MTKERRPKKVKLVEIPSSPVSSECQNAWVILKYTQSTAKSFLNAFDSSKIDKGAPTHGETDLLRAMLVLVSAGLDSMVKYLVRDALPAVIRNDMEARKKFIGFVKDRFELSPDSETPSPKHTILASNILDEINKQDGNDYDVLFEVIISRVVKDLRGRSLQSPSQIMQTARGFNIAEDTITIHKQSLREVFKIRNQISHDMDIKFEGSPGKSNRRPRRRNDMVAHANLLLTVSVNFLQAVDAKLSAY